MADKKNNILKIDLDVWTTQAQKANDSGIRLNTISQQIKRARAGEAGSHGIEYWEIPELNNLILVKK